MLRNDEIFFVYSKNGSIQACITKTRRTSLLHVSYTDVVTLAVGTGKKIIQRDKRRFGWTAMRTSSTYPTHQMCCI